MVTFAVAANYYMLCDSDPTYKAINRGPFSPVGIDWPPGPRYLQVVITLKAPAHVKAGTTLTYFVTIANADTVDYVLNPCPDYTEFLGPKLVVAQYRLNCAPVGRIKPTEAVTFEMRMPIAKSVPAGNYKVMWSLADGRVGQPFATADVAIN
jgi:hypothetical protein